MCSDLDINHCDSQGKNAFHHVVNPMEYGSYENVDIAKLLIKKKCNVNQKDATEKTPLDYAKLQESFTLQNLLEGAGAHFNPKLLMKRAPTSIISMATWPEEEIDYEADAKAYIEEKQKEEKHSQKDQAVEPDQYVNQKYAPPASCFHGTASHTTHSTRSTHTPPHAPHILHHTLHTLHTPHTPHSPYTQPHPTTL